MQKPLIAVVRGGYSGESVISHQSAACMMRGMDEAQYEGCYLTITRDEWTCEAPDGTTLPFDRGTFFVGSQPGGRVISGVLVAIHGSPGEDGKLQGQLDMLGIPCQTGSVLNMALTFSKFTTSALLRQQGFHVARSVLLYPEMDDLYQRAASVGLPCFVKPDQAGSSLGISKVKAEAQMATALEVAFAECRHVMVEAALKGREITCGVIEKGGRPVALPVCEIRTSHEFFDYNAKYHAADTQEIVPAPIPEDIAERIQQRSVDIYLGLGCRGMVRVDHFWDEEASVADAITTIEVNTVPGFTSASIMPKMLAAAGIGTGTIVNAMIADLLERSA